MTLPARRQWWPLVAVGILAALCGSLAILQYRWIGEVSSAERERLEKDLTGRLEGFRQAFGERIEGQRRILTPSPDEIEADGSKAAWSSRFRRWRAAGLPMFSKVALALPNDGDVVLLLPDASGSFVPAPWPAEWTSEHRHLAMRLQGPGFGPPEDNRVPGLIEIPDFGPRPPGRGPSREQSWLLLEINRAYIRSTLAPELTTRFLTGGDYDAAIRDGSGFLYESAAGTGHAISASPDALVELNAMAPGPEPPPMGGRGRGAPRGRMIARPPGAAPSDAAWTLLARHRAGSLEAIVEQARRRNIAVSAGMLLLIVAIVAMLVRLARQKEHLAALQMNFVTGVSHELRTPLTVIRTAAFNLRGKIARSPEQVERYGALIEEQSRTLTELVDRVLLFARTGAGLASGDRSLVSVDELIGAAVKAAAAEATGFTVEKHFDAGLPMLSVDAGALTQALRNLIENAVKYSGSAGWVGIRAVLCGDQVEITVADRGPGIPENERGHVFDAFFRGRQAIAEQIHGTGLGLNLAKSIVMANGGDIRVRNAASGGAEFTITLPAAAPPADSKEITDAAYSAR